MASQFKFFQIPVVQNDETEEALNQFLRSHRVLHIRSEFVSVEERSFWSLQVEYLTGIAKAAVVASKTTRKAKVDYKEILSPDDFSIYVNLRDWRKTIAEKDGLPVYVIFTNEQLAKMVESRITSKEEMKKIDGVGDARIEKYGADVISIINKPPPLKDEK